MKKSKIQRIMRTYKKYSLPSRIGIIAFIFSIITVLVFNIYPIVKLNCQSKFEKYSLKNTQRVFSETLLNIALNEYNKADFLYRRNVSKIMPEYKQDFIYWYSQALFDNNEYKTALTKLSSELSSNDSLIDNKVISNYLVSGFISSMSNGDLKTVEEFVSKFPEIIEKYNFVELINIDKILNDHDSCLNFLLNNKIVISNNRFDRLLQYNLWTCIFNQYDDTLIQVYALAIQNHLFPEVISNTFLTTYLSFVNLRLFDNNKRLGTIKQIQIAYSELDKNKGSQNYNEIILLINNLSKLCGYFPDNQFDSSIITILNKTIPKNHVVLAYDCYYKESSFYILYVEGALWKKESPQDDIMESFFQESTIKLVKFSNNKQYTLYEENYGPPPHFLHILADSNFGFYFITSDGTYEGKRIDFYKPSLTTTSVNNLYDFQKNQDYHSNSYFTYYENNERVFYWNYEIDNLTQSNIVRKVACVCEVRHITTDNKTSITKHYTNTVIKYIEDLYEKQTKTQIKIMNKITINNKSVDNKTLIELMKKPSEFYLSTLIDNTQLWLPESLQPIHTIFILENRNKNDEHIDDTFNGFVFLINRGENNCSIEQIFEVKNNRFIKSLL